MATIPRATLEDLYRVEGKAELINGSVVSLMSTGRLPNRVAGRIYRRIDDYAESQGVGEAYTDNMGFTVPMLSSGRESFSPDASFYCGAFGADVWRFIDVAPTFAVAVRSDNDHGASAEAEMAAKRADYFEAGTLVVWDVDPLAETIACYRVNAPKHPIIWARGATADAEPAMPGWRVAVDDIFQ